MYVNISFSHSHSGLSTNYWSYIYIYVTFFFILKTTKHFLHSNFFIFIGSSTWRIVYITPDHGYSRCHQEYISKNGRQSIRSNMKLRLKQPTNDKNGHFSARDRSLTNDLMWNFIRYESSSSSRIVDTTLNHWYPRCTGRRTFSHQEYIKPTYMEF